MITALIVAAGQGVRMGGTLRKQYMTIGGRTILELTLKAFDLSPSITNTVLVVPEEEISFCQDHIIAAADLKKETVIVPGGGRRQDSVYNGLQVVKEEKGNIVLIHDGVRPFVTVEIIETCITGVRKWGACIPALEVTDTLKEVSSAGVVEITVARDALWAVQTPQAFSLGVIKEAHERALEFGWEGTDDASLVEMMGLDVHIVPGDVDNIKITTPGDLKRAELLFNARRRSDAE